MKRLGEAYNMCREKLAAKIKESSRNRTQEERLELMKKAQIIDKEGYYLNNCIPDDLVQRDRRGTVLC